VRPECRHASDWFMIAYLRTFIANTNCNPLVQFKETENNWVLLVREVVGAQISSYWAHGRLEVPQIKWVRTNNYKFHTFRSVHFDPSLCPRPSFRFSEGLVLRLVRHDKQLKLMGSLLYITSMGMMSLFRNKNCAALPL